MHDRNLISFDEHDGAHALESGDVAPMFVGQDATTISDGDIQNIIALCASFFSTFNSVMGAMQSQRASQSPVRMSA